MTVVTDGVHLASNDVNELHRFAAEIGLDRRLFHAHRKHPHYDLITPEIAKRAADAGAEQVSSRMLLQIIGKKS